MGNTLRSAAGGIRRRRLLATRTTWPTALALALSVTPCACSRAPRGDPRGSGVEITMTWFFANGGDCAGNRVAEILLRGNQLGSDAIPMRVPCGDGSLRFPPGGTRIEPGGWIFEAQALDAIGLSCFETLTTTLTLEAGEEDHHRLIFHAKTEGRSSVCEDIGEDVDGGVPDPEPDAGPDGGTGDAGPEGCGCVQDDTCMPGTWDSACGMNGEECHPCTGRCSDEPGCDGTLYYLGFCGPADEGSVGGQCFLGGDPVPHCCSGGLACDPVEGCVMP